VKEVADFLLLGVHSKREIALHSCSDPAEYFPSPRMSSDRCFLTNTVIPAWFPRTLPDDHLRLQMGTACGASWKKWNTSPLRHNAADRMMHDTPADDKQFNSPLPETAFTFRSFTLP